MDQLSMHFVGETDFSVPEETIKALEKVGVVFNRDFVFFALEQHLLNFPGSGMVLQQGEGGELLYDGDGGGTYG